MRGTAARYLDFQTLMMSTDPDTSAVSQPFVRADFGSEARRRLLNQGRWANATVFIHEQGGAQWVVKDFIDCPLLYRKTVGRFMVGHELSALERLRGLSSIPADAFRVDACALAYRFVPGKELADVGPDRATPAFFRQLEETVLAMHNREIAHLELRSGGNILVTDAATPLLIDFQSHLKSRYLPRFLKRILYTFDLGSIYKHWSHRHPDSLGAERRAVLARVTGWRRFWWWRPYFWMKRPQDDTRSAGE